MTSPVIEISVAPTVEFAESEIKRLASRAIAAAVPIGKLKLHPHAELSLLVSDDETLARLNAQWRGKEGATNVLSFPAAEISIGDMSGPLIGDIAISWQTLSREARLENKSPEAHFSHLIVHGFLHLFGYDHETEIQAEQMEGLETKILNHLGYEDPYRSDV